MCGSTFNVFDRSFLVQLKTNILTSPLLINDWLINDWLINSTISFITQPTVLHFICFPTCFFPLENVAYLIVRMVKEWENILNTKLTVQWTKYNEFGGHYNTSVCNHSEIGKHRNPYSIQKFIYVVQQALNDFIFH